MKRASLKRSSTSSTTSDDIASIKSRDRPSSSFSAPLRSSSSSSILSAFSSQRISSEPAIKSKSNNNNIDNDDNDNKAHNKKRRTKKLSSSPNKEPPWLTQLQNSQRRRSRRSNTSSSLQDLARILLSNEPVLFVTGAGLSAASGIRPFRGSDGIWSEVIWKRSTREEFRKDPLEWYNSFWLKYFPPHTYGEYFEPNEGHEAISMLANIPGVDVKVITQNVDGLHSMTRCDWNHEKKLIEAHGRLGLYKCIPESDSDTDSDSDDEEDRKVKLGSRRKSRALRAAYKRGKKIRNQQQMQLNEHTTNEREVPKEEVERIPCKYEIVESIPVQMIGPPHVGQILAGIDPSELSSSSEYHSSDSSCEKEYDESNVYSLAPDSASTEHSSSSDEAVDKRKLHRHTKNLHRKKNIDNITTAQPQIYIKKPPLCPSCQRPCPPQALLFDEGYHSHGHYQFERMERWIEQATAIVFVGTSFAVSLTDCALEHAREEGKLVYNFNIDAGKLESTAWLNVENVVGDVQRTLPALMKACEEELMMRSSGG